MKIYNPFVKKCDQEIETPRVMIRLTKARDEVQAFRMLIGPCRMRLNRILPGADFVLVRNSFAKVPNSSDEKIKITD